MTSVLNELVRKTEPRATSMLAYLQESGIHQPDILKLMASLPRHEFVEPAFSHLAYSPTPLPIGKNQTISQPLTVARMSEWLLQYARRGRVLEIGTGSGYQTCILANLFNKVHTIERQKALLDLAMKRLANFGVSNVEFHHGDGHLGWPTNISMDAIIVTALASKVPHALTNSLKEGGILIMPIEDETPSIGCWQKTGEKWRRLEFAPAQFVPMLEGKEDA
ncbi:protein-L-isoaspartate(D-aspartate) O-methyltransferase [Marinomonas mediterranea]|jgi:protein-L-isoaspartate(D-aspartate) O-methyltransferase|uniref:Protein-L-isoaspartate O-methyltransferase n=1 Tax=Marinomonas mediterranea (strain ATCC 700492 / JCM 21426 / NBRC 103028 / MMB-1) TaxID=717774 RepID=F2JUN9_MARM1|nr:protein-L-isoaspartate(D-aspartate) O-methyltransferase [Marinomonas mediterranea]ADZ90454.1 protein-L-isoaspartate O-methyltransferase [Marinomonas mediterranea MMB-1]WCN16636.1 protein-L-isoaspartate(D-aspartate) O-methyltransferase [Marinomonas mediterranea MMB-1]